MTILIIMVDMTLAQLEQAIIQNIFSNETEQISGDVQQLILLNIVRSMLVTADSLPLSGANGGTGAANSGKTITLAGNLSTIGAFNLVLTVGADSTPTFPAGAGTLPYLAGVNNWTNVQTISANLIVDMGGAFVCLGPVTLGSTGLTGTTTVTDNRNFVFGTSNGTKFGTSTAQRMALWNKTPIAQPTTGIAAAAFVQNTSNIDDDTATFGGYTIGQAIQAMRNFGLLA